MSDREFKIESLHDLPKAVIWLWQHLATEKHIAFEGEMGAGKTTIVKALCQYLGVKSEVTSPTFALVNEYSAEKIKTLYHFDFYRIDNPVEALDFGLEEYLASGGLCLMEWSEKVSEFLPEDMCTVSIDVLSDQSRLLQLS